jgi:Ca2+-binding EF-hand superfamily protein
MSTRDFDQAVSNFIEFNADNGDSITIDEIIQGLIYFVNYLNGTYGTDIHYPTLRTLEPLLVDFLGRQPGSAPMPFNTHETNILISAYMNTLQMDFSILQTAFIDRWGHDSPHARAVRRETEQCRTAAAAYEPTIRDRETLRNLFNFLDTDNSGSLSERELRELFDLFPRSWPGVEHYYNDDVFDHFDRDKSGFLDINEFGALMLGLNEHMIERFDTNALVPFLHEIYSPAPPATVVTCTPTLRGPSNLNGPSEETIYSCIPGTRYTYYRLAQACATTLTASTDKKKIGSVHDSRVSNSGIVEEVLRNATFATSSTFVMPRPPFSASTLRDLSQKFLICLNENQYWDKVEPARKKGEIDAVLAMLTDEHDKGMEIFWMTYRFLALQPDLRMLNLFIGSFIRQVIQADMHLKNGTTIERWDRSKSISCAKGVRERIIPELGLAIAAKFGVEVERIFTPEEIEAATKVRKHTLLGIWLQEYINAHEHDASVPGFRNYVLNQITRSPQDNNPADWEADIREFTDSAGFRMMFGGRKNRFKTHYYKRKQTKRKQTKRKQTKRKQTKRKQTKRK